jgi:hypothetical protein
MSILSAVFLVVYAVVCIGCILYWAVRRTSKGGWGLLAPVGFIWVIQLGCIVFVKLHHDSALRLFWLVPLSIIVYVILAKVLYATGVYESGV